jgi:hypothetical protein
MHAEKTGGNQININGDSGVDLTCPINDDALVAKHSFTILYSTQRSIFYRCVLWNVDPLLGNDSETNN